jgi:hypothetical protein
MSSAFGDETLSGGEADTGATAGDQGDFSV